MGEQERGMGVPVGRKALSQCHTLDLLEETLPRPPEPTKSSLTFLFLHFKE